jgi:amino acid transporter
MKYIFYTGPITFASIALVAMCVPQPVQALSSGASVRLQNPLVTDTIQEFLLAVLRIFMIVAIPIVILFIILAGFKFVTAQGNAEELQTAKRALMYALIGGLIILGAVVIVGIVTNLVGVFTGGS